MIQKHQLFNKEVYLGGSKKIRGREYQATKSDKKFILKSAKYDFVNSSGDRGVEN